MSFRLPQRNIFITHESRDKLQRIEATFQRIHRTNAQLIKYKIFERTNPIKPYKAFKVWYKYCPYSSSISKPLISNEIRYKLRKIILTQNFIKYSKGKK